MKILKNNDNFFFQIEELHNMYHIKILNWINFCIIATSYEGQPKKNKIIYLLKSYLFTKLFIVR